jgi:serine/threonine protein kinase
MRQGTRRALCKPVPFSSLAERDPEPVTAAQDAHDPLHFESQDAAHDPDDPDEATVADAVELDDQPTTIRPTPVPPHLTLREADTVPASSRGRARGRVGKYELHTRLARGSFGVVYTAHDPNLERNVAIKVLRPTHLANQDVVQRFLQEARATARVRHPGIVTIHDCGTVDTRRGRAAFIAMELLSGESLTSRLARAGRLDPPAACEIIRQVASALEAAHQVDVLHRDLKPDNIYLVPDPAMPTGERVKVLDFGLAKLGDGGQTLLQSVFGTPRYMSPEQSRSATQIDHRSDIYSLGCILFELVTGRPPFDGDVRQLIERHQRATPPRAAQLAPGISTALDDLIASLLAKDPLHRPQSMALVQRALRVAVDGSAEARPPEGTPVPLPLPPPAPTTEADGPVLPRTPSSPRLRPSSAPPVRPPSAPSTIPDAPPAPSCPVLSTPSVEISISGAPLPPDGQDERPAAPGLPVLPMLEDGAMSGELLVPASGVAPAAFPSPQAAPARHDTALFGLCVLVLAALAALAVVTIA